MSKNYGDNMIFGAHKQITVLQENVADLERKNAALLHELNVAIKSNEEQKRLNKQLSNLIHKLEETIIDEHAVTYTEIRKRWLYACKDGSPDLRYNGNRQIEYPVEVNGFEYGNIIITIGKQTVEFSLSSSNALDMFERIPSIYCHECKHKHNPIPRFLDLMEIVSEDKVAIEYIAGLFICCA